MAIVKMNKFTAIGLDHVRETLLARLIELGVTELNAQDAKLDDEAWAALVSKEEGRERDVLELENRINALDSALKVIDAYDTAKKPLFSARRPVAESAFSRGAEEKERVEADVRTVLDLTSRLKELMNAKNKIETAILGLNPWRPCGIPLEIQETERVYVFKGSIPARSDIRQLKSEMEAVTDLFELTLVSEDQEHQYVSLICLKGAENVTRDALKRSGFSKMFFKELTGSAADNIARYESELVRIAENTMETEKELAAMVDRKEAFQLLYDYLTVERDKAKAANRTLTTGRTFYLDGWVPAAESENLAAILRQQGCHCEIEEPAKGEETPVLLKNSKFITPIESITTLYDLPNSREIDPTPIYGMFYVCFFGIMFADIGYGLLLMGLSFAMTRSGKLEGGAYKFIKQLGYCGVSTCVWGVLFGSFFGNLLTVTSETFFGQTIYLKPLLIDPIDDSMTVLIFACIFGVFHIFVALGVKAYGYFRDGRALDAVNECFTWYLLITGLGLLIAGGTVLPGAAAIGKWMSVAGAGGMILIPVFTGKGVGKLLGLWNLYGITRYLADILSYARLLALCLAGSVIAQVFNIIASIPGSGIVGVILFIVIVTAAHVFNFFISALGAFVHSIRLQYVEFFGKFYEGKGIPFEPFMKNTKYVKIIKEER